VHIQFQEALSWIKIEGKNEEGNPEWFPAVEDVDANRNVILWLFPQLCK